MTILLTAYNPSFSEKVKAIISAKVEPTMVSTHSDSQSFDLEAIVNIITHFGNDNDQEILENLNQQNVDYIEF